MKYRILSAEELAPLNEEFLKYLLVSNITPQNWEVLKKEDEAACHKHIEIFSDMVLDKILSEVKFADVLLENRIEVYQFLKGKAYVFAIENKVQGDFNFLSQSLKDLNLKKVNILKGEKAYLEERELEIFKILQKENASISNGDLFKKAALLAV